MAGTGTQSLYTQLSEMCNNWVESISKSIQDDRNDALSKLNGDSKASSSNSENINPFRKIEIPQTRTGLGSTEGDIVYLVKNYLEIVGLVFFVWLLGYMNFSVSWILLGVFLYFFRQRQRAQFRLRHQMLGQMNENEEKYIKARLDELPSWVFFPDVERAEWVNRILKQAWPYANQYLEKSIFRDMMIPLIQSASSALSSFTFEKLDLGDIPPRIGGVKVYTDNVRDQIMIDLEVFYAGDARIKAKLKGIVCGIKDIQFVGDLRIILSPLINTIPIVGAVSYFFLRNPSIQFKLTDAGSLVDVAGLNDMMLTQIRDILASMMVLPNRQVFPLVQNLPIEQLKWSNPQGVIRVYIIRAQNLIKADISILGKGKSDPFVRVKALGSAEYKTKTIDNTTDPEWNEVFELVVEQAEDNPLQFEVFDEDPGKDDFIGRADYPVSALVGKEAVDTWLTLKDVKKGSLNVNMQYFTLTKDKSTLAIMDQVNLRMTKREKISKALLVCYIDRCQNLPRSKKTQREPNVFCRVRVEGTEIKTKIIESATHPKFEQVAQILCTNPLHEKIKIDVCDARSNNEVIGYFELPISQVYDTETMTIETQPFALKRSSDILDKAEIFLRLSLLILCPGPPVRARLNPEIRSPSLYSNTSADTSFTYGMDGSPDMKRNGVREPKLQEPFGSNTEKKSTASSSPLPSNTPLNTQRSTISNRLTSDKKSILVCDDPDLKSVKYGRIKLGIRYTVSRSSLSVTVFKCNQLINVHEKNLPDPYIRLNLIPDFKKDKKKTKSIHDTLNPVYDDLFEWPGSLADIRRQRLNLSVKNNSPLFAHEQTYMGDVQIDLSNLDPEKTSIAWYALQEPNTSGGGILKIKYDTLESNELNKES